MPLKRVLVASYSLCPPNFLLGANHLLTESHHQTVHVNLVRESGATFEDQLQVKHKWDLQSDKNKKKSTTFCLTFGDSNDSHHKKCRHWKDVDKSRWLSNKVQTTIIHQRHQNNQNENEAISDELIYFRFTLIRIKLTHDVFIQQSWICCTINNTAKPPYS